MEKKPRIFKTLDEFLNEYPEDKYLRVFPTLAVSEELPDYITFAAHTLPFEDPPTKAVARGDEPDRSDTFWIEDPKPAKGQWSADPGWISFTRHGLDRIALAMGIQWIEEVRIDNQRDPMVCTYRAHGSLSFITGARSEIQVYRLDLHVREDKKRKDTWNHPPKNAQVRGKWLWWKSQDGVLASPEVQEQIVESRVEDYILQLRDVIEQRAQTGARSRVIRAFSGLPNKFRPGRLMEKPLAILQVIYRPRPQTSEERMHLHGILAGVYSGGYPGQGQIAQTVRPQLTEGSREIVLPVGEEVEVQTIPIQDDDTQAPEAPQTSPEPAGGPIAPSGDGVGQDPGESKISAPEWIQEAIALHDELATLTSAEVAKKALQELARERGVKRLDELKDPQLQKELLLQLREEIQMLKDQKGGATGEATASSASAPPPEEAPPYPFSRWVGWSSEGLMKIRYAGLQRLPEDRLLEVINETGYPADDPQDIAKILNKGIDRENLLEAAMLVVEYHLKNPPKRSS